MSDNGPRVADAIAAALANGLTHPGSATDRGPVALLNATFRPQGRPPHLADAIRANNQVIGEAIVYLIENQLALDLVDRKAQ